MPDAPSAAARRPAATARKARSERDRTGWPTPCSTRSTRSRSRTPTATGSATCPGRSPTWTTWPGSAWTRSGSTPASPRRSGTRATTSPTTSIAPRYGTQRRHGRLRRGRPRARASGSLLDLVAGHTSTEHDWFRRVRRRRDGRPLHLVRPARAGRFVPSPGPAPGLLPEELLRRAARAELRLRPARTRPSRGASPSTRPGPQANREALREIIAFWLDRGVAGFRVDMAYSLVKDDPGFAATAALWREISGLDARGVPGRGAAAGERRARHRPTSACAAGFDADFFLVIHAAHSALFNNGGAGTLFWLPDHERCYFDADGHGRGRRWSGSCGSGTSTTPAAGADRLVVLGLGRPRLLPAGRRRPGRGSSSAWRSRSC